MGTWVVLLETSCVPFGSPIEMGGAFEGGGMSDPAMMLMVHAVSKITGLVCGSGNEFSVPTWTGEWNGKFCPGGRTWMADEL